MAWLTLAAVLIVLEGAALPSLERNQIAEAGQALETIGAVLIKTNGSALSSDAFKELAVSAWQAAGHPSGTEEYNGPGSVQRAELFEGIYDVNAGRTNSMPVPPHSEQSYLYLVPRFVAFTCFKPASEGGHLQLFDNGKIAEELPLLVQKLKQHEVLYQRLLGDNSTDKWHYATGHWQSKYETFDFESAQRKAAEDDILGGQAGSTLERYLEDTVRMEWTIPAVTTIDSKDYMLHAILDNQKKFNENSGLPPFHSMFGNREEFSDTELDALRSATQSSLSHEVLMSPGDVIVLDNWKWAHGRRPYVGHRVHGSVISDRRPRSTTPKGREEL